MNQITTVLENRLKFLEKITNQKKSALRHVPTGNLRISASGKNSVQYYVRKEKGPKNGIYIPKKQLDLAFRLAQKDYDQKVVDAAEQESAILRKCLENYPEICVEDVMAQLHPERQKLIAPIRLEDDQFIAEWRSVEYEGKTDWPAGEELITDRGERVRSKSELIIADLLERKSIPYRYEYPVFIEGMGIVYPDFTVLNVRLRREYLWEHMGMMDDQTYAENAVRKINRYILNGYYPGDNLILTYETRSNPISLQVVRSLVEKHFL